jgi:hypothetical protein
VTLLLPRGVVGTMQHWAAQRRAGADAKGAASAAAAAAAAKPQPAE